MFDPVGVPAAGPEEVRAAARSRLESVLRDHPVRRRDDGVRRAVRLAPGVYRTAQLPPAWSGVESARPSLAAAAAADSDAARAAGLRTATVLDDQVPGSLSSRDLLDGVAGWDELISWAHARQAEWVAEFARRRPGPYAPDEPSRQVSEFAADEIAARLRVTRRSAELKLGFALDLDDRLPATAQALRAGRIDVGKAKAIAELTANVADQASRAAVEARVLTRAGEQTGPELRRSVLRAVAKVDPAANIKRHRRAKDERYIRVEPCGDGMAELSGRLAAEDAATVFGAVDSLARCAPPDDPRSIDARRADALVDLCRPGRGFDDLLPVPTSGGGTSAGAPVVPARGLSGCSPAAASDVTTSGTGGTPTDPAARSAAPAGVAVVVRRFG
jgi:hypothetical protein